MICFVHDGISRAQAMLKTTKRLVDTCMYKFILFNHPMGGEIVKGKIV
jgi:hypothetical protein